MEHGGKTLRNTKSGETGDALRLWRGLLVGTGVLAAAMAASPAEAGTGTAQRAGDCPPEESSTQSGDRRGDRSHLTAEEAAAYDRELHEALRDQQGPDATEPAQGGTVPVAVHIVHAEDGTGDLDESTVDEQIEVMNEAFGGEYEGAGTGFDFRLADTTRTAEDEWFEDFAANEEEAKSELRQGGAETLNLYITDLGDGVLGEATFPQEYSADAENDGVVVDYRTVPGGSQEGFDLGYTAVHETGHWLGLFHTFQNGCNEPGDYVDDTPYEAEQSSGCPEGRDTCPDRAGDDPVHNFMNYSDDSCLDNFTEGQAERMAEHWTAFRAQESDSSGAEFPEIPDFSQTGWAAAGPVAGL